MFPQGWPGVSRGSGGAACPGRSCSVEHCLHLPAFDPGHDTCRICLPSLSQSITWAGDARLTLGEGACRASSGSPELPRAGEDLRRAGNKQFNGWRRYLR